jgi:hypothetical protein
MTKKQHDVLKILSEGRAYVVRLRQRRIYSLIRPSRRGKSNDLTQAVFAAIKPHLNPQTVRPGELLPDGSCWRDPQPATIWKAAG